MISVDYEQVVYAGNGSQDAWPYSFPIDDGDVIRLILIDTDGTEINIEQDYFVDVPGSTVYYPGYAPGEEPPVADQPPKVQSGQKLIVYRDTEITQDSDLGDSWPFNVIEKALDKLTMILQEKAFTLARCLKISQGQAAEIDNYDPTVPLEAGKVICGNEDGTGFEAREALMEVNGAWDGEGRQIHSVTDPTGDQDAATKNYVDDNINYVDNSFMKLQDGGEAWEGRGLPISNVAGPALIKDAANKDYVDRILAGYSGQGARFVFFDNVAQMQAAELVPSQMAVTLGYYDVNDGGAGVYTIRDIGADTPDGGSIIEIPGTDYVAELITDGTVNVKQFGAYGDGGSVNPHDDTDKFMAMCNAAVAHGYSNLVIPYGEYYVTENCMFFNGAEGITINGNNAILYDDSPYPHSGGYTKSGLISFLTCSNVHVNNLKIISQTKKGQSGIIFTSCTNFSARNIYISNIVRYGIVICPAWEYDGICSDFVLENITTDHTGSHGLYFTIINNANIPVGAQYIITDGYINNCCASYAGTQIGDSYASDKWTAGIDFGELLQRLENVTFVGCSTQYAIESGFHCEGGTKLVNVKFIGCSAFNNAKRSGGANFGAGWTMPYGCILSSCRTGNNKVPLLLISTPVYAIANKTKFDVVDDDAGVISYDNNMQLFVDTKDGELFANPNFAKNIGMSYTDSGNASIYNAYVNVSADADGNRYIKMSGLTTNAFVTNVGDFIEINGVYYKDSDVSSTTNLFNMRFRSYDGQHSFLTTPDGTTNSLAPFSVSRYPADVSETPIHFRMLQYISSLTTNAKYLALQFTAMYAKIFNLEIRNVETIINENLIADDVDYSSGKYLINVSSNNYYGGMLNASTSSPFKITRYNDENWLVRRNNDNASGDVAFGAFPYNGHMCNVEVVLLSVCASSSNDVTSKIRLINFADGTGSTPQTISVTNTIQRDIFTFDVDALGQKMFGVRIDEAGVTAGSPNTYYRVESIKIVPKP